MENKALSIKSVFAYAYSPFYKGFSRGMILLTGVTMLFNFIGYQTYQRIAPFIDLVGNYGYYRNFLDSATLARLILIHGTFLSLLFIFLVIIALMEVKLALAIYENKQVNQSILPSYSIFSNYFRTVFLAICINVLFGQITIGFPKLLFFLVSRQTRPNILYIYVLLFYLVVLFYYLSARLGLYHFTALNSSSAKESLYKSWNLTQGKVWVLIRPGILSLVLGGLLCLVIISGISLLFGKITTLFAGIISVTLFINLPQILINSYLYRQLSAEKAAQ